MLGATVNFANRREGAGRGLGQPMVLCESVARHPSEDTWVGAGQHACKRTVEPVQVYGLSVSPPRGSGEREPAKEIVGIEGTGIAPFLLAFQKAVDPRRSTAIMAIEVHA